MHRGLASTVSKITVEGIHNVCSNFKLSSAAFRLAPSTGWLICRQNTATSLCVLKTAAKPSDVAFSIVFLNFDNCEPEVVSDCRIRRLRCRISREPFELESPNFTVKSTLTCPTLSSDMASLPAVGCYREKTVENIASDGFGYNGLRKV